MPELTRDIPTDALEALVTFERAHEPATPAALADRLHLDGPVDDVVRAMVEHGIAEHDGDRVRLTENGRHLAVVAMRRHALVERLLRDVLRVPWSRVHHEAERWDGVISDDVEARLVDLLGDPGTCPHGNPIPGSANRPDLRDAIPLADCATGPAVVQRIAEELETDDEALVLLDDAGLTPGRDAEVLGRGPDGSVEVAGAIADVVVPPHVAALTYVSPR